MKKLIYSTLFVLATSFGFSQNNETINNGKVIGSFDLGSQVITTILDESTNCIRKTSPHRKGLFTPNENVKIVLKENKQSAEVRKSGLSKKVFTNKNCGNDQQECLSPLCIIRNDDKKLILKFTDGNYRVFYNATRNSNNNSIKSNLIIYGGNNGNGAIPISYYLDKSNAMQFKLLSHKGVIEEADKLLNQKGVQISAAEESLLEKLILNIKTSDSNFNSELAKSIYYHTAIVKTVKRAIENNATDCNCAPVPLYFTNSSPFLCQQDLKYDVNELLDNLKSNPSFITEKYDSLTVEQVKSYLERRSSKVDFISFEESYIALSNGVATNEFNDIIDDHIETAWCLLGQGSDLGCCGNYSGCCWYWSNGCLMHDLACLNCEPGWYCFDGCVPL